MTSIPLQLKSYYCMTMPAQGNVMAKSKDYLQYKVGRIDEGVLMQGSAVTGLWLQGVMAITLY